MESASYVWNLISNNALLATLVATACVGGISALYKSLKHHGLLKLPLVLPDASGENSGKDFLDALLEPAPGVLPLEGRQRELEELYRFIRHENRKLGIILLTGGGGMGKTRLAAELCSSLAVSCCRWKWWEKWDVGFLNPSEDLSSPFFNPEHLGNGGIGGKRWSSSMRPPAKENSWRSSFLIWELTTARGGRSFSFS